MEEEMRRRYMGVNEFARLCNVSNGTISKYQSKNPPEPTLKFLKKLSQGTNTPLFTLLCIIHPELEEETKVDAETLTLLKQLMRLPQTERDMFFRIAESIHNSGKKQ